MFTYTLLIFLLLGWVAQTDHVRVKHIQLNELNRASEIEIKTIIEQELSGSYALVIPRQNILFTPKDAIKNNILLDYRIKDVSIDRKLFDTLNVLVDERTSDGVWCPEKSTIANTGTEDTVIPALAKTCYLLDDGFVFDVVSVSIPVVDVPEFTIEGSPYDVTLGTRIIEELRSKEIIDFISYLETEDITTKKVYISDNGDSTITTSRGVDILFSDGMPIKDTIDNFFTVVHSLELTPRNLEPGNGFDELLYIDFRFGKKIFYKLR